MAASVHHAKPAPPCIRAQHVWAVSGHGLQDAQETARLLDRHPGRKCARDNFARPSLGRPGVAWLVCAHNAGDAVVAKTPVLWLRQSGWRSAGRKYPQTSLLHSLAWLTESGLQASKKSRFPAEVLLQTLRDALGKRYVGLASSVKAVLQGPTIVYRCEFHISALLSDQG